MLPLHCAREGPTEGFCPIIDLDDTHGGWAEIRNRRRQMVI